MRLRAKNMFNITPVSVQKSWSRKGGSKLFPPSKPFLFSHMWVVVGGGDLLSRDIFQVGGLVLQSAYIGQGTKTPLPLLQMPVNFWSLHVCPHFCRQKQSHLCNAASFCSISLL